MNYQTPTAEDISPWQTLPKLRDGHPSMENRRAGWELDENQEMVPRYEPVPCGDWFNGGEVFCRDHEKLFQEEYPQGWRSYPGDICPHGMYTGGSGIDWMCHQCEMGYD